MAMTCQEIEEFAQEVVVEVLEIIEDLEKTNNSRFKRVPKYEITYLISTIRELSTTVLNLSKTAASAERMIELKDEEIITFQRESLKLALEVNDLKAKLGD